MKIKELGLLHFGKFNNRKIKFKDGINLINGNNESGKSTTFSFITGVLYGFSKDSKSRRLYDENKEKYKPWKSEKYSGYMEIESEDDFRIERDFINDKISFVNLSNGKDLSEDEKLNEYSRIKQPGAYIFNVNRDFFINTVFIGQLETKIDENSYDVLRNKMLNIHQSSDENINVKKACEILENSLKNLGKTTRKSSEIGSLSNEIDDLKEKITRLEYETEGYNKLLQETDETKIKLNTLYSKKDYFNKVKDQKLYNEILEKEEEIKSLKEMETSECDRDYAKILQVEKEIYSINEELNNLNSKLLKISSFSKTLNKDELEKDYEKVVNYKTLKNNSINSNIELESLRNEIKNNRGIMEKLLYLMIASIIVIAIILVVSLFTKKYYINFISIAAIVFIYLKLSKYKVNKEMGTLLEKKRNEINLKNKEGKNSEEYNDILEKYKKDSDIIENYLKEELKKAEFEEFKYMSLNEEKHKLKVIVDEKVNRKMELGNIIEGLNNKYNIFDTEELKKYLLSNSNKITEDRIQSLENIIEIMLKGLDKNKLNHNIDIQDCDVSDISFLIKEEETKEIKLKERLNIVEKKIKILENLKEDLSYKENMLKKLLKEKENTEKALETILRLLDENRDDNLPNIVKKMNYILSKITGDKYTEVLMDNDFNIKIKDNNIDSFIDLKYLSSGTADQIYFSFRIAFSELLLKNAPIIMDDHFLQYDDERLENTLKFIEELKNERQILLFSATEREKICLDKLNIEYNYIYLN